MDLTSLLLFCLISGIIGSVLMLLVQYYVFVKYFNVPGATPEQISINEKHFLPEAILKKLQTSTDSERHNPITAYNLIFQFIFHEIRNSSRARNWFYRKLTIELEELITKTTIGRLFDKLQLRDLDLGGHFPEMRNIRVHNAELHETEGFLESLDILLDIFYEGNFMVSIDADMLLGKKAFVSVKVKHLSGLSRLQFTRKPYTHWSLSFLGDPKVEFDVETQFQGRQMQSNISTLISNQIRKAIRRKHTLPNYKVRYKPFFQKCEDEFDAGDFAIEGFMEVKICELSRLSIPANVSQIFCTITLTPIPWVLARQQDDKNLKISVDLQIRKAKNQQIGIVFKQTENCVVIENIIPNTPATKANFCRGDILISIEGKRVTHIANISKIIKSLSTNLLTFRVERTIPGFIHNENGVDKTEIYEDINDLNISFSKLTDSVQIAPKLSRKNSSDRPPSNESSRSNTPTNSPRKQDDNISVKSSKSRNLSRGNSETIITDDLMNRPLSNISNTPKDELLVETKSTDSLISYQQHTSVECLTNSFIKMDDLSQFQLNEQFQYFNLNVFGRSNEDVHLLGYVNIPIQNLIGQYSETHLNHMVKMYRLLPPNLTNLASHNVPPQSGFEPSFCYGDVVLSFVWTGYLPGQTPLELSKKSKIFAQKPTTCDKEEMDRSRLHDFIRTHFHRSTQCDFCGKKIWLKDAVQCRECGMCCHKKCITKCQNSTVCGSVEPVSGASSATSMPTVEFKVTDTDLELEYPDEMDESNRPPGNEQHRQSFSEIISQGIKRVNSANNLVIPNIVSAMNQGSRSLPPSPQHTPRKQSLVNQSTNPFAAVAQKLEQIPDDIGEISREQISGITDPLIGFSTPDDLMGLAKSSSQNLYIDLDPKERVNKINSLLGKLRLALDSETTAHANLITSGVDFMSTRSLSSLESSKAPMETNLLLQTKAPTTKDVHHDVARRAILVGQSEERVQVLSIVMLHLCTGLQHAQGIASQ